MDGRKFTNKRKKEKRKDSVRSKKGEREFIRQVVID